MRILGQAAAAAAILSLAAAPALAAPGASASVRGSTASKHESDIAGAPIIAIIGLVAIVAGGVIIATQDDDPDSP